MALEADRENGPAARSFAADAHDCIMVRIKRSYRIQVCGTKRCPPMASSPWILNRQTGTIQMPKPCKSPYRSSSSLRVLRPQGAAKHNRRYAASRQALLPFRSLDPFRALREPDRRRRDEERLSRSEQRTGTNQNDHLTGKAPYKPEIRLPPAATQGRTCLSREFAFLRRDAAVFRGCAGRGERRGRRARRGLSAPFFWKRRSS